MSGNLLRCGIIDNRACNHVLVRGKDDPYGLAPIKVTEAESKPSSRCDFALNSSSAKCRRSTEAVRDGGFCI